MKLNIIFIAATLAYGSSIVLGLPFDSEFVTRDLSDLDDVNAREFDEEIFEREPKSTDLDSAEPKFKKLDSELPYSTHKVGDSEVKESHASKSKTKSETSKPKKKSLLSRLRAKKSTQKKKRLSLRQRLARKRSARRRSSKAKKAHNLDNKKSHTGKKKSHLSKLKSRFSKKGKGKAATTTDVNPNKSKVAVEKEQHGNVVKHESLETLD